MNKFLAAAAALVISGTAFAQVGTTVKEGAKATGDKIEQGAQATAGAVTSEPSKSVHKAKAKYHKAKAAQEATAAKEAASNIGK